MFANRGPGRALPRRLLVAAAGLFLLAQAAPRPSAASTREELERARAKVERIEKELTRARKLERAIRLDIESLIRQIQQARFQKEAIEEEIAQTRRGIRASGREIRELQGRLNERARDAYIRGPIEIVEVVLDAESLVDLSDRVSFIDTLSRADANLAVGIQAGRAQLQGYKEDLLGLRRQQVELLKLLKAQGLELEEKFAAAAAVAKRISEKLEEAKEVVADLELRYQQELLASSAFSAGRPPPDVDGKPGPLFVCPVEAPRSYINDFGFPRVGHLHQGNDVFAPAGAEVYAPFSGTAEEGSNSLGGLTVHVYADDGTGDYVYNAHLSAYAGVGGRVEQGQVVGYVGNTGNARGTPPHDHFEYHPGGGGAITPYFYLNEACGVGGAGL